MHSSDECGITASTKAFRVSTMLTHITINNYTIVSTVDLELGPGMTVITGETGAGKSIMLDALGLCLGDRADSGTVRPGCERAEIIATFAIDQLPAARHWLQERDLYDSDQCLMRRVLTREGRSRAYINGTPCTLADCTALGALLMDIHSQHAHQSLLRRDTQRELLDAYANATTTADKVRAQARQWQQLQQQINSLKAASEEHNAQTQLLSYQVQELDELALTTGEYEQLEAEQHQLANAEEILNSSHQALEQCDTQMTAVQHSLQLMDAKTHDSSAAERARELLESAAIALSEARGEIQSHLDRVNTDPQRLQEVELRLQQAHDISRKHRIKPHDIVDLHARLNQELAALAGSDQQLDVLEQNLVTINDTYLKEAKKLGKQRQRAAAALCKAVEHELTQLSMSHCRFVVALNPRDNTNPHAQGLETVEFLIATQPNAEPQALAKIASGGELSRISLAISVITAAASSVPSRVFDEVDVGIGGATSEVVGRLLRSLSEQTQVLCVTHLAQVAALGHQHLQVTRLGSKDSVETQLLALQGDARVNEIARMAGGLTITDKHLAHARELLKAAP